MFRTEINSQLICSVLIIYIIQSLINYGPFEIYFLLRILLAKCIKKDATVTYLDKYLIEYYDCIIGDNLTEIRIYIS